MSDDRWAGVPAALEAMNPSGEYFRSRQEREESWLLVRDACKEMREWIEKAAAQLEASQVDFENRYGPQLRKMKDATYLKRHPPKKGDDAA